MIYLDNSATSFIKPSSVKNALLEAVNKYSVNPGRGNYKLSLELSEKIYETRNNLSEFFGGYGAENVVFFASCTVAINQVIFSLLGEGGHVVVSDLEHNAVMRPLYKLREKGLKISFAEVCEKDKDKTLDNFRKAINKDTKLIVCTAGSNVFGIRPPFERIAALANLYGIKILVDASQAAGIIDINMRESGIDYLCFPAHKGLYGIMGLGVLMIKEGETLTPLVYGGTGVESISESQPLLPPERYESGTLNVPGIIALNEGVKFVKSKGVFRIHKWETERLKEIYYYLKGNKRVKLYTDIPDTENYLPVLSFNTDFPSERMAELYGEKGVCIRSGLHCAPVAHKKYGTLNVGTVRISPSAFTSVNDVREFIRVTGQILRVN